MRKGTIVREMNSPKYTVFNDISFPIFKIKILVQ